MAFIVHVSAGPIGQLFDFLELLPSDVRGPELHRIASELEGGLNVQFCGNSAR